MNLPEETAADRVRAFLRKRSTMRGLDPQHIIAANEAVITVADLETLIGQADAYRQHAEVAHAIFERGPVEGTCVEHLHTHVGQCYRRGLQDGHNQAAEAVITEVPL